MSDRTSGRHSQQRWTVLSRTGVLVGIVSGAVLLIAACGGGGSPTVGTSRTGQQALAFAQCMRSHGEPGFPDPSSQGNFNISQININDPQYHAALSACGQFRAGLQLQMSGAQQQELIKQYLKLAACMRSHGLPDFPDPDVQDIKAGYVIFSIPSSVTKSPKFPSAEKACGRA